MVGGRMRSHDSGSPLSTFTPPVPPPFPRISLPPSARPELGHEDAERPGFFAGEEAGGWESYRPPDLGPGRTGSGRRGFVVRPPPHPTPPHAPRWAPPPPSSIGMPGRAPRISSLPAASRWASSPPGPSLTGSSSV